MASLHQTTQHGKTVYRLTWNDRVGQRRTIRLGAVGKTAAEGIQHNVERIVNLVDSDQPLDRQASGWIRKINNRLADKLAQFGLIPQRSTATLGQFVDAYLDGRKDMKPNSIRIYRTARDSLVEFFGAERNLRDI